MKKRLLLSLLASTAVFADITIEGMNCPEGYSNKQGEKTFQECKRYDKDAAARAQYPKESKECIDNKECLIKEDKLIKTKIEN
jgi:hypothetical protein